MSHTINPFTYITLLANVHCKESFVWHEVWFLLHYWCWDLTGTPLGYPSVACVVEILWPWVCRTSPFMCSSRSTDGMHVGIVQHITLIMVLGSCQLCLPEQGELFCIILVTSSLVTMNKSQGQFSYLPVLRVRYTVLPRCGIGATILSAAAYEGQGQPSALRFLWLHGQLFHLPQIVMEGRGDQGVLSILPKTPFNWEVSHGDSSLILRISWLTHPHILMELAVLPDHWEMQSLLYWVLWLVVGKGGSPACMTSGSALSPASGGDWLGKEGICSLTLLPHDR